MSSNHQRTAFVRRCDIERKLKDASRRSAEEQAALAVQEFESKIELLLTIHEEPIERIDWKAIASELRPLDWRNSDQNEVRAIQTHTLQAALKQKGSYEKIEEARGYDRIINDAGRRATAEAIARWERRTALARSILARETRAYTDALAEHSSISEMESLGTHVRYIVHSPGFLECLLSVKGTDVIPSEAKSLTSTGKLSTKPMARARFHEIYQDFVCGCTLRLAREVFATLPVESLIVTATIQTSPDDQGPVNTSPVISAIITAQELANVGFANVDASDTMERFKHRGNFKATRKSGAFQPIVPFSRHDLPQAHTADSDLGELLTQVANARNQIRTGLS